MVTSLPECEDQIPGGDVQLVMESPVTMLCGLDAECWERFPDNPRPLEAAKHNLRHGVKAVGLAEAFAVSLELFGCLLPAFFGSLRFGDGGRNSAGRPAAESPATPPPRRTEWLHKVKHTSHNRNVLPKRIYQSQTPSLDETNGTHLFYRIVWAERELYDVARERFADGCRQCGLSWDG